AARLRRRRRAGHPARAVGAHPHHPTPGRTSRPPPPARPPPPPPPPPPPVLIGGAGEKHTLRLVARYGDACNLFDIPDGGRTLRHKLDVLAGHCEQIGRPYTDVEKTVSTRLDADAGPGAFADQCSRLAALGLGHAVVITNGPWTPAKIAMLTGAMRV